MKINYEDGWEIKPVEDPPPPSPRCIISGRVRIKTAKKFQMCNSSIPLAYRLSCLNLYYVSGLMKVINDKGNASDMSY
jgi:hypothetical protein